MLSSLLWQLVPPEDAPQTAPSYLFGTMHVRDLRAFEWMGLVEQYMSGCAVFATEFDFSEMDQSALGAALRLPEGYDLETLLGRGAWKRLQRVAENNPYLPAATLRWQHPMAISTALSATNLSNESPHSLDEALWHLANHLGLQTTGVETFADQLQTLRSIDLQTHTRQLSGLLKRQYGHQRHVGRMLEQYRRGDIQALYKSAKRETHGLRYALIYRRNALMALRFIEIAREQPLFCAVGAAHLAGAKGMLRLLKHAGFRLKTVTIDN